MAGHQSSYHLSNQDGPNLPPELEREIFEWAATAYPSCSPALILVAQRVKQWIEPSLYNILVLGLNDWQVHYPEIYPGNSKERDSCLDEAITYKAAGYAEHILLLGWTPSAVGIFLKRCPKVRDLAIWNLQFFEPLIPILQPLQLQRLSIEENYLFAKDGERLIFDHTSFASLTHLDVILEESPDLRQWDQWDNLVLLPNLTHLAFDEPTPQLIKRLLAKCDQLKVLVLLYDSNDFCHDEILVDIVDKRFVELRINMTSAWVDWKSDAHGCEGFWVKAENTVMERHQQKERKT